VSEQAVLWLPPGRSIRELIDPSFRADPRVLAYLRDAPVVMAAGRQAWICELGCAPGRDAYALRCDNEFLWPNVLEHYVADHQVRLPQPMLDHIARRGFQPPAQRELDFTRVPPPYGPPPQQDFG